MIPLIIYEAVWIFALWWDHSKTLGILYDLAFMAIPFFFIARHYSKYGSSSLNQWDNAFFDTVSDLDDTPPSGGHDDIFNDDSSHNKSHADWVTESLEKDKNRGKEYDRMWAEEHMDEHDY